MKIDAKSFDGFFDAAKRSGDAAAAAKLGNAAAAFRALDSDGDGLLTAADRPTSVDASLALLETARAAHRQGSLDFAETGYAIGLSTTNATTAPNARAVQSALWNMAQIKADKGETEVALTLLHRLCFDPKGVATNDAAAHAKRGQLLIARYERLTGRNDSDLTRTGPMTIDLTTDRGMVLRSAALTALDDAKRAFVAADAAFRKNSDTLGTDPETLREVIVTGMAYGSVENMRVVFQMAEAVKQELEGGQQPRLNDPEFINAMREAVRQIRGELEKLGFSASQTRTLWEKWYRDPQFNPFQ